MGQGSSRVLGYKESRANNVLSQVSHGDLTTVAIVRFEESIAADQLWPFFKRFLGLATFPPARPFLSPASATIPDVVETNLPDES